MVHKAIDLAAPGDVIVVDAGGDLDQAIIGEIMSSWAAKRGVAGFVIDGAIRDAAALSQGDFPVYARGVTHRGPYKDGPGEINVPVSIGGMVVQPGDIIIGDADGLLAIPQADAEASSPAPRAQKQERRGVARRHCRRQARPRVGRRGAEGEGAQARVPPRSAPPHDGGMTVPRLREIVGIRRPGRGVRAVVPRQPPPRPSIMARLRPSGR